MLSIKNNFNSIRILTFLSNYSMFTYRITYLSCNVTYINDYPQFNMTENIIEICKKDRYIYVIISPAQHYDDSYVISSTAIQRSFQYVFRVHTLSAGCRYILQLFMLYGYHIRPLPSHSQPHERRRRARPGYERLSRGGCFIGRWENNQ